MWVEVKEKYEYHLKKDIERYDKMAMELPPAKIKYRRRLFRLADVFGPIELTEKETDLEFYDGSIITVEGSYDKLKQEIESKSEEEAGYEASNEEDGTGLVV